MRILLTMPHFYRQSGRALHGSEGDDAKGRAGALLRSLGNFQQLFGERQGLIVPPERCVRPANTDTAFDKLDVVICTTRGQHLLNYVPQWMYRHHATQVDPKLLGYECHTVLKESLEDYDWFGFMEDDILVNDPMHFMKLAWFNELTHHEAVLQPNRFERSIHAPLHRLYLDGNIVDETMSAKFQDVSDQPKVTGEAFGREFVFQRIDNPHAGCFFLSAHQMKHWASQPHFLQRESGFWGPLESAATLGLMRTFRTYKPARENASFLEVEHAHVGYLGARLRFDDRPPYRF